MRAGCLLEDFFAWVDHEPARGVGEEDGAVDEDGSLPIAGEGEARRHESGAEDAAHDADVRAANVKARAPPGADHRDASEEIAESAHAGATEAQPEATRGPVGGGAAKQIAGDGGDERKTGQDGERGGFEAIFLLEKRRQPRDAEIKRAAVGTVG